MPAAALLHGDSEIASCAASRRKKNRIKFQWQGDNSIKFDRLKINCVFLRGPLTFHSEVSKETISLMKKNDIYTTCTIFLTLYKIYTIYN